MTDLTVQGRLSVRRAPHDGAVAVTLTVGDVLTLRLTERQATALAGSLLRECGVEIASATGSGA